MSSVYIDAELQAVVQAAVARVRAAVARVRPEEKGKAVSAIYTEAEFQAELQAAVQATEAWVRAEERRKTDERVRVVVARALADCEAAERATPPEKALLREELLASEVPLDRRNEDNVCVFLAPSPAQ